MEVNRFGNFNAKLKSLIVSNEMKKLRSYILPKIPGIAFLIVFLFVINGNFFLQQKSYSWKVIIADEKNPREKLIVTGTIYNLDRKTPAEGVTVYVYHTDAKGIYGKGEELLDGTMITDKDGKYKYHTIKPGSYPDSKNLAHVHYKVSGKDIPEQWFELRFEGDPFISKEESPKETLKGNFSQIQKLVKDKDGVNNCRMDIRLEK